MSTNAEILKKILSKHPELMDFAFAKIIQMRRDELHRESKELDTLEAVWSLLKEDSA